MAIEDDVIRLQDSVSHLSNQILILQQRLQDYDITKQELLELKYMLFYEHYYFVAVLFRNNISMRLEDLVKARDHAIKAFNESQHEYIATPVGEYEHSITKKSL